MQSFLGRVRILVDGDEDGRAELPSLKWTDRFSVDHEVLDHDHRRLFTLFNDLSEAMQVGKSKAVISTVLDNLIDYTSVHFAREEQLMAAGSYPDLLAHRKLHEAFVAKVQQARERFSTSSSNTQAMETLNFVKDWLINHIQKSDRAYVPYLGTTRRVAVG